MDIIYAIYAAVVGIGIWELIKFFAYEIVTRKNRKATKAYWTEQVREVVGTEVDMSVELVDGEHWRPGEYRMSWMYTDKQGRPVRKTVEVRRTDDYVPGEE